jgi:hypothetical protein
MSPKSKLDQSRPVRRFPLVEDNHFGQHGEDRWIALGAEVVEKHFGSLAEAMLAGDPNCGAPGPRVGLAESLAQEVLGDSPNMSAPDECATASEYETHAHQYRDGLRPWHAHP